jgi:hypothetical protein
VGPPIKIKRRKTIKEMKWIPQKNECLSVSVMTALGSRCQTISIRATDNAAKKIVCLEMHH